ncbi:hypothetical protein, partial [Escherichia coli]|uniref:hypothetical protein n=1 Tax=Escherichia coli TaxID=562 RepID=UPI001BFC0732
MRKSIISQPQYREGEGSMTFTRRQVLGGLAGLAVVGLGAGGARFWLARPQVAQEYDYELIAAPLDLEI